MEGFSKVSWKVFFVLCENSNGWLNCTTETLILSSFKRRELPSFIKKHYHPVYHFFEPRYSHENISIPMLLFWRADRETATIDEQMTYDLQINLWPIYENSTIDRQVWGSFRATVWRQKAACFWFMIYDHLEQNNGKISKGIFGIEYNDTNKNQTSIPDAKAKLQHGRYEFYGIKWWHCRNSLKTYELRPNLTHMCTKWRGNNKLF